MGFFISLSSFNISLIICSIDLCTSLSKGPGYPYSGLAETFQTFSFFGSSLLVISLYSVFNLLSFLSKAKNGNTNKFTSDLI